MTQWLERLCLWWWDCAEWSLCTCIWILSVHTCLYRCPGGCWDAGTAGRCLCCGLSWRLIHPPILQTGPGYLQAHEQQSVIDPTYSRCAHTYRQSLKNVSAPQIFMYFFYKTVTSLKTCSIYTVQRIWLLRERHFQGWTWKAAVEGQRQLFSQRIITVCSFERHRWCAVDFSQSHVSVPFHRFLFTMFQAK